MADRHASKLSDVELEAALHGLRPEFPATPDLAAAIAPRLASVDGARRQPSLRLALLIAAALVLLAAGAAVAGAFGVGPMRIVFQPGPLPSANVSDTPRALRLALGTRLAPTDLAGRTELPLMIPSDLGSPDEAYLSDIGIVTLVWGAGPELPEIGATDIGLLLMEIPGDIEPNLIEKVVIESEVDLERVRMVGTTGYWISGGPHILRYLRSSGRDGSVTSRLVDEALVWERDGLVLRIESALGRDASVALAERMVPWRP